MAATTPSLQHFVPPKPSQLAQHFPKLEILDLIGQGGMGAVYKARQRDLDRFVALKILPPDAGRDPTFAERFSREARTLARLNHPNIVGIHDFGQAGGLFYFLMEYVDGISLRQAIDTGQLSSKEALAIVPQICDALQFAHDEGIVHRDIKPENVLLDKRGRVKIADFGLARLLGQVPDSFRLTASHQVMGTPRYMAPEQMEGSHDVDHRADIYSLGVVFYEMLTRELPLGRFAPPSRKVQIDVRLDDVVLRTLEKEPDRRYQQASQIKTDVESIRHAGHRVPGYDRMYGYEYRSPRELFGLPLVHVAKGFDPKTGRKRVAKGIIAIGDVAVGGLLAVGGMAFGPIALGGVALGLFTVGGASVGLLGALGGVAAGMGLSGGGGAIGTIATGGAAVGVYAYGGAAAGLHVYGAPAQDPEALALWTRLAGPLPAGVWLVLAFLAPLAFLLVCLLAAGLFARRPEDTRVPKVMGVDRGEPSRSQSGFGLGLGCLLAVLLLVPLVGFCLIASLVVGWYRTVEVRPSHAEIAPQSLVTQAELPYRAWEFRDGVPAITQAFAEQQRLDSQQQAQVNQVLRGSFQDYLKLEQAHTERQRPTPNQQILRIEPFPAEAWAAIENRFWTRLDEILNINQQAAARQQLSLEPPDEQRTLSMGTTVDLRTPDTLPAGLRPGILGWGPSGCLISIRQVGSWYEWEMVHGSFQTKAEGPQLPVELRRFWTDANNDDPATPQTESKPESPAAVER